MLMLTSSLVFFSYDFEQDTPIIELLESHFKAVTVITELKKVCEALIEPSPKVFIFAGETLAISIASYYKALDACSKHISCEHKVVTLVSKSQEKLAFDAFNGGVIDEYLLFRPLLEPYRAILVCKHLLAELGVTKVAHQSDEDFQQQSSQFPIKLNQLVERGKLQKESCNAAFEKTITDLELIIEKAINSLDQKHTVSIDIQHVATLLSKIKTNELRPKLLKLQAKTLQLLEVALNQSTQKASPLVEELIKDVENIEEHEPKTAYNALYNNLDKIEEALQQNDLKKSVLVVEDDVISQQLTNKLLTKFSLHVDVVNSGRRAFAALSCNKYDLVLMDINLPDTNGIYIVDQIVSNNTINSDTPIVMLSGNKNRETVKEAIQRGAKGYIVKPLFKPAVEKLLRKFQLIT